MHFSVMFIYMHLDLCRSNVIVAIDFSDFCWRGERRKFARRLIPMEANLKYVALLALVAALVGFFKPYIPNVKRWHFAVAAFVSFIAVGMLAPTQKSGDQRSVQSNGDARGVKDATPTAEIIEAVKGALREEPQVKDFLYQPGEAVEWQIGVISDGTSRIGYANYICELLASHGASTDKTIVRIADVVKIESGTALRDANLGAVRCKDRSVFQAYKP